MRGCAHLNTFPEVRKGKLELSVMLKVVKKADRSYVVGSAAKVSSTTMSTWRPSQIIVAGGNTFPSDAGTSLTFAWHMDGRPGTGWPCRLGPTMPIYHAAWATLTPRLHWISGPCSHRSDTLLYSPRRRLTEDEGGIVALSKVGNTISKEPVACECNTLSMILAPRLHQPPAPICTCQLFLS